MEKYNCIICYFDIYRLIKERNDYLNKKNLINVIMNTCKRGKSLGILKNAFELFKIINFFIDNY